MPRIAHEREPAEPSSPEQRERYQRILRSAVGIGVKQPLERVQMAEVAKDAGVAIATLYRYFPSKTHLFSAVLHRQIRQLDRIVVPRAPSASPAEAVADLLVEAGRALLQWPLLAHSMLQSNHVVISSTESDLRVSRAFGAMLVKVAGFDEVSALDQRLIRLMEQTWYGILISVLNGFISSAEAEFDTRLACERLLSDLGSSVPMQERTVLEVFAGR